MQHLGVKPFDRLFALGQIVPHLLEYLVVGGIAVVMASSFMACSFDPPPNVNMSDPWTPAEVEAIMASAPQKNFTQKERQRTTNGIDNGDTFATYHGYGCAQSERAWTELSNGDDVIGLRVRDSIELLSDQHRAVVLLNGYRLKYLNSDHKLRGLGSWIFNVRREPTIVGNELRYVLKWDAGGVLTDADANDPFEWCYYYTVAMWDKRNVHAYVSNRVGEGQDPSRHDLTFVHPEGETAEFRVLSGENALFNPRAVLPLGFGMMYEGGLVDHNVLQVGFDLDANISINADPANPGNNRISWDSAMVLKDNTEHKFLGAETVMVLGGTGVELRQPQTPFFLLPRNPRSCDISPESRFEYRRQRVQVSLLPYDYAVPVLAGWNIGDVCDDNHVQELGAWIQSWQYKNRTLSYEIVSVFRDKNSTSSGSLGSAVPDYKVNILGFNSN